MTVSVRRSNQRDGPYAANVYIRDQLIIELMICLPETCFFEINLKTLESMFAHCSFAIGSERGRRWVFRGRRSMSGRLVVSSSID